MTTDARGRRSLGTTTPIGQASDGAIAAADRIPAEIGASILSMGGNAADAAVAAAAAMAVTSPHMCGLGGDLFALVSPAGGSLVALNASGRAGSGADPNRLRADGLTAMPFAHDVHSVTVPGCVAGLTALHERFGSLALSELLAPACRLADEGFAVSPTLAEASTELADSERADAFGGAAVLRRGQVLALPRIARVLESIGAGGASAFYQGEPGEALLTLGAGEFSEDDLRTIRADWVAPLRLSAFGRELWTAPPNSQGYIALSSAWIAERLQRGDHPHDEEWTFLLIEAARQAAFDREDVLHEHADGESLIAEARLRPRLDAICATASRRLNDLYADGGTTYLCAIDRDRTAVSLIMSNAADFGSRLTLPGCGIFLHNRGIGFSLRPQHPSEYGPGRRPPHTLAPLLVTSPGGHVEAVLGTMGGDAQPQILLQLLVRMLALGHNPADAIAAPRWILSSEETTGFNTWQGDGMPTVRLEHGAPSAWATGLNARGYPAYQSEPGDQWFGHAQAIRVTEAGGLIGAADPRSGNGAYIANATS